MPRPLHVFLCHASQDKPAVRELYNVLKSEDWIDPWLDKAKILPGQDWEMVIEKAVEDSDVVIICLSNQSVTKEGFVQREIRYAYDLALEKPEDTIFLIPLRLDDCSVPRKLKTFHWVDYFGTQKQEAFADLLEALELRYDQKLKVEALKLDREKPKRQTKQETTIAREREKNPALRAWKKKPNVKTAPVIEKLDIPTWAIGLFALVVISLSIWGVSKLGIGGISAIQTPQVDLPVQANGPAKAEAPIVVTSIATMISGKDGMTMVFIPAGEFTMGSDADNALAECQKYMSNCKRGDFTDEEPPHSVYLDAFWIDQTEVTNAIYAKCVADGICKEPTSTYSLTHSSYYGNSEFNDYPVMNVDWNMAKTYCEWAGRELPTEAQWEKAARGVNGNIYPWGNTFNGSALNFCDVNCPFDWAYKAFNDGYADVSPVGSYPSGQSIYGAYDMAGNDWEWVNGWYDVYPGGDANSSSNFGQKYRVIRGGGWDQQNVASMRSASRVVYSPRNSALGVGFRCSFSQ